VRVPPEKERRMSRFSELIRHVIVLGAVSVACAGCLKGGLPDITGSVASQAPASSALANSALAGSAPNSVAPTSPQQAARESSWRAYTETWGKKYDAAPGDKTASLNYARGLRAIGQRNQAVSVLQGAVARSPKDLELLAAFGKALSEAGELKRAQEVLARAHTPERPDWRVLSAQGAVADQLGDHQQAQTLYQTALRLKPNEPAILTNLGLSYALSKQLPQAESVLRSAANLPGADSRTRQNLSLVLGLQGKFPEAEAVARADMSSVEAAQSVSSIRQMVSQSNSWSAIKSLDQKGAAAAKKPPARAVGQAPLTLPSATPPNG
jgi:Flp pilus assembly protein TadD